MAKAFRFDMAQHLAAASRQETVTYGDLAREFGGTDRGWDDTLRGANFGVTTRGCRCFRSSLCPSQPGCHPQMLASIGTWGL